MEKIGTTTLVVLRMGVHQLLSMRVPAHAALNQSVALARAQIGGGPANFVNAVLRRVSERSRDDWYARLEADAKDDTEKLCARKIASNLDCAFHASSACGSWQVSGRNSGTS